MQVSFDANPRNNNLASRQKKLLSYQEKRWSELITNLRTTDDRYKNNAKKNIKN